METTTPGLAVTHHSTVTEEQIDHLGHMNVRFYGVNAAAGTRALLAELGVGRRRAQVVDLYTRHRREQLLGAELVVRSGGGGPARRRSASTTSWGTRRPAISPRRSCTGSCVDAARLLALPDGRGRRPRTG